MLKSTGGFCIGIKAPDTLVLIIEKQHASWSLMATATSALDLRFRCQLRIGHSLRTAEVCISCVLLASGKWALLRDETVLYVSLSLILACDQPLWGSSGLKFERF